MVLSVSNCCNILVIQRHYISLDLCLCLLFMGYMFRYCIMVMQYEINEI